MSKRQGWVIKKGSKPFIRMSRFVHVRTSSNGVQMKVLPHTVHELQLVCCLQRPATQSLTLFPAPNSHPLRKLLPKVGMCDVTVMMCLELICLLLPEYYHLATFAVPNERVETCTGVILPCQSKIREISLCVRTRGKLDKPE